MAAEVEDVEITLVYGDSRLKVSPYGASMRGLWREDTQGVRQEIITDYTGAKGKMGGQGDVLLPFPGRVRDGRYTFEGQSYQMPQNDKDGPNAIHGFLRLMAWDIAEQSENAITFTVTLPADANPGYPFTLRVNMAYRIDAQGLTCRFEAQNVGAQAAPFAAGFHPYFTVGSARIDTDTLHVPMEATLEFENLLPTGNILPVAATPFDFRQPRPIGEMKFNTCYLHPVRDSDGLLRLRLSDDSGQRDVTVWMDSAFDYVVIYSGDPMPESHRRRALAIEPMTCASDGFNRPEWGLIALAPGQTTSGSWGVTF